MLRRVAALNALCLFASVTVYIAAIGASARSSGSLELAAMNLFFMAVMAAGIAFYGAGRSRRPAPPLRPSLMAALGAGAASVIGMAALHDSGAGQAARYAALFPFALTNGYVMGHLFFLIARHVPAERQGNAVGVFMACANFCLFLSDSLAEFFHVPPYYAALLALALMARLLPEGNGETGETTRDEQAPAPALARRAPLFVLAAALLSLTVGFGDSLYLTRHEEYMAWHRYSRLLEVPGCLLAGRLADFYPVYLPLAALLARSVSLLFCVLLIEGGPAGASFLADCFFTTFLIVFLVWGFIRLSAHLSRPALWAGMGRIVELPCSAAGTLLGVALILLRLPSALTFGIYVAMLMAAVALYYQVMLVGRVGFWESAGDEEGEEEREDRRGQGEPAAISGEPAPAEGFAEAERAEDAPETEEQISEEELFFAEESVAPELFAEPSPMPDEPLEETARLGTKPRERPRHAGAAEKTAPQPNPAAWDEPERPKPKPTFDLPPKELETLLRRFDDFYGLTRREQEVQRELLQRRSIAEISQRLAISPNTVKYHIGNILRKTGAKTQAELRQTLRYQKRRLDKGQAMLPPGAENAGE